MFETPLRVIRRFSEGTRGPLEFRDDLVRFGRLLSQADILRRSQSALGTKNYIFVNNEGALRDPKWNSPKESKSQRDLNFIILSSGKALTNSSRELFVSK